MTQDGSNWDHWVAATNVSVSPGVCQDVQAVFVSYQRNCDSLQVMNLNLNLHPIMACKGEIARDKEGLSREQISWI